MMIRRLVQLNLGLCLFGVALALMVRARLGLDPWNVFHQGRQRRCSAVNPAPSSD